jgi:hypothetical protein
VFNIYIKELVASIRLVVSVSLIISFNVKEWLKALLANITLIKVALLSVSSLKAVR